MIVKVFKVSTAEMWTMRDKKALVQFVEQEIGSYVPKRLTINQIIKYLPVEDYCRVK